MFMMYPSIQDKRKVGSFIVSSNKGASIPGFSKAQDLTMCCAHSGTGHYPHTHFIVALFIHTPVSEVLRCVIVFLKIFLLLHRVTSLTRLPSALVELSEPLQVIRYEHGDFSNSHYDSSPSNSETTCAHTRLAGNTSALTEVPCRYVFLLL